MICREFWTMDREFGVRIPMSVLKDIDLMTKKAHPFETGGILVGKHTDDRRLAIIISATSPTQDSRLRQFRFYRGVGKLNQMLKSLWNKADRQYYLGEWHYHPSPRVVPSNQDIKQISRISKAKQYRCSEPIMLIAGIAAIPTPLHLEIATSSGRRLILTEKMR